MIRCLELYSGIGGFHYALKESGFPAEVCAAIDINPNANVVYKHNFPDTYSMNRNIQSLTAEELDDMKLDLLWLSPPCQPFTRVGNKKDSEDNRTSSFLHILNIIPKMKLKPTYFLLENVKGFETSDTRNYLLNTLKECNYTFQEFLLSPVQFGIPNSRLRYYIIAKLEPRRFSFETSSDVMFEIPGREKEPIRYLSEFLEDSNDDFLLPDIVLTKFCKLFDIVDEKMSQSCCFTKAYGQYVEGTGSILHSDLNTKLCDVFSIIDEKLTDERERLRLLRSLKLRYFTPKEIANLMGFPSHFSFPEVTSRKQKNKLLGNSLNVKVVCNLIRICIDIN